MNKTLDEKWLNILGLWALILVYLISLQSKIGFSAWLSILIFFVSLLMIFFLSIEALKDVFRSERSFLYKASWLFIIIFTLGLGSLIFFPIERGSEKIEKTVAKKKKKEKKKE